MKRFFARFFLLLSAALIILLLTAIVHTYVFTPSRQLTVKAQSTRFPDSALARLSEAIRIRTVTPVVAENRDTVQFLRFHQFLKSNYPLAYQYLNPETVGQYSLLFTWQGKDPNKSPYLLMAHQDVVPVDDPAQWELPPFSGIRHNGFIYGRGTLDIKSGLLGILEAVESLLKSRYKPERTVYLAFGHDEESGKGTGTQAIATLLKNRNIKLDFVLDEGGLILKKALPGLKKPVALIGIAEKGFVNIKMTASGKGGHGSMPEKQTSVTRLAESIDRINRHPFPARLEVPAKAMFEYTAPEMSFPFNVLFSNSWLFGPLIKSQMAKSPSSNAAIRTTVAFTILQGSSKENVIPSEAFAVANIRLMPGVSEADVMHHLQESVNDSAITFSVIPPFQPASQVSATDVAGFRNIQKSVESVFPEVVVAPFLLVAFTDSRHYAGIARNIYRFDPAVFAKEDLARFHGRNERIREDNYHKMMNFYRNLILFSDQQ